MKKHAEFAPSAAHRWMRCPGSVSLSRKVPPQAESPYAKEGTEAHSVLEFILSEMPELSEIHKLKDKYGHEMVEHAVFAAKEIAKLGKPTDELLVEHKVKAHHPECWGTIDAAIISPKTLTVIDYKYGAGVAVEVEENEQLLTYALGLYKLYPREKIRLVVIQPRAWHEDGSVRIWETDSKRLKKHAIEIGNAIFYAKSRTEDYTTGDHCKFCPATSICPELYEGAIAQAGLDFDTADDLATPTFVGSDLPTLLDAADKLEIWIEGIRSYAFQRLQRGEKIDGYKLVHKRGTRQWIDETSAAKEAKKKWGESAFSTPTLLSPSQLEKQVKEARAWVAEKVTTVVSGYTMVKESDKRKAVNPIDNEFPDDHSITNKQTKLISKGLKK